MMEANNFDEDCANYQDIPEVSYCVYFNKEDDSNKNTIVNQLLCGPFETKGEAKDAQKHLEQGGVQAIIKAVIDCD